MATMTIPMIVKPPIIPPMIAPMLWVFTAASLREDDELSLTVARLLEVCRGLFRRVCESASVGSTRSTVVVTVSQTVSQGSSVARDDADSPGVGYKIVVSGPTDTVTSSSKPSVPSAIVSV